MASVASLVSVDRVQDVAPFNGVDVLKTGELIVAGHCFSARKHFLPEDPWRSAAAGAAAVGPQAAARYL
jgi:hypothetical protein